jgi:hypothetical protein
MTRTFGYTPWVPLSERFKSKKKRLKHFVPYMYSLIHEINNCPIRNFECFVTSDWQCDSGAPSERFCSDRN